MRTIGRALQEWADVELHADFLFHAKTIIRRYRDNAPRIDTGEWVVDCEREINAYLPVFSEEAGVQLRPIRLEYDVNSDWPTPVVEPATHGPQGDQTCAPTTSS